jgi:myo-inositol-1(or 4)-monophosphatase
LDPIDGTWAFINHSDTFATSLSVFHDGKILIGIIVNPSTGELAYSAAGRRARLMQLSLLGEPDVGVDLPLGSTDSALLINVQPSHLAGDLFGRLHRAWKTSDVRMVKAAGGSPLWALVEAAKGRFVYINLWSRRPAEPYDLASGVKLIRCAGGDVVDLANRPVELTGHMGPFIAGIDSCQREQVVNLVAEMADAFA